MSLFWVGYVFLLCTRGPISDSGCAGPCRVFRAVPRLAAHIIVMLTKLWLDGKWAKRSLSRYLFSRVTGLFLLGPVAPKVIKGAADLVGKVGPSSPYLTM